MLLETVTEILEGGRKRDPKTGLIFPWYTWPCLHWLDSLDLAGKRVFEYGIGDSTLWYVSKRANVWYVETNEKWVEYVAGKIDDEDWGSILCSDKERYLVAPKHVGAQLDVIIIDGDWRDECTEHALKSLKSGGYLIIDNYHQPSVDPNDWHLTDKLIEGMPIMIYKQPNHPDWQTAVITMP